MTLSTTAAELARRAEARGRAARDRSRAHALSVPQRPGGLARNPPRRRGCGHTGHRHGDIDGAEAARGRRLQGRARGVMIARRTGAALALIPRSARRCGGGRAMPRPPAPLAGAGAPATTRPCWPSTEKIRPARRAQAPGWYMEGAGTPGAPAPPIPHRGSPRGCSAGWKEACRRLRFPAGARRGHHSKAAA